MYVFFFCCPRENILEEMGQSIQKWTKLNMWKTAFKKFEVLWSV